MLSSLNLSQEDLFRTIFCHTTFCSAPYSDAANWLKKVQVQAQIWPRHDVKFYFACQCLLVFLSSTSSFLSILVSALRTQTCSSSLTTPTSHSKSVSICQEPLGCNAVHISHFRLTLIIILKASDSGFFSFLYHLLLKMTPVEKLQALQLCMCKKKVELKVVVWWLIWWYCKDRKKYVKYIYTICICIYCTYIYATYLLTV